MPVNASLKLFGSAWPVSSLSTCRTCTTKAYPHCADMHVLHKRACFDCVDDALAILPRQSIRAMQTVSNADSMDSSRARCSGLLVEGQTLIGRLSTCRTQTAHESMFSSSRPITGHSRAEAHSVHVRFWSNGLSRRASVFQTVAGMRCSLPAATDAGRSGGRGRR
jgi:hypothetical protein